MAVKKPVKRQSTKKALVKQILPKAKPRRKSPKSEVVEKRWLEGIGDLSTQVDGETMLVHLTIHATITDLTISVNGRGVWKGQP